MTKHTLIILCAISVLLLGSSHMAYASYQITSKPIAAQDGTTIPEEEREMIRALVPFFTAINSKDVKTMKKLYINMRNTSDEELLKRFEPVKSYTFHGLENVIYKAGKLTANGLMSAELIRPGMVGKTIAPYCITIEMVREGDVWVISGWSQIRSGDHSLEYFDFVLSKIEKAEKRYGVKDVSVWKGL